MFSKANPPQNGVEHRRRDRKRRPNGRVAVCSVLIGRLRSQPDLLVLLLFLFSVAVKCGRPIISRFPVWRPFFSLSPFPPRRFVSFSLFKKKLIFLLHFFNSKFSSRSFPRRARSHFFLKFCNWPLRFPTPSFASFSFRLARLLFRRRWFPLSCAGPALASFDSFSVFLFANGIVLCNLIIFSVRKQTFLHLPLCQRIDNENECLRCPFVAKMMFANGEDDVSLPLGFFLNGVLCFFFLAFSSVAPNRKIFF